MLNPPILVKSRGCQLSCQSGPASAPNVVRFGFTFSIAGSNHWSFEPQTYPDSDEISPSWEYVGSNSYSDYLDVLRGIEFTGGSGTEYYALWENITYYCRFWYTNSEEPAAPQIDVRTWNIGERLFSYQ